MVTYSVLQYISAKTNLGHATSLNIIVVYGKIQQPQQRITLVKVLVKTMLYSVLLYIFLFYLPVVTAKNDTYFGRGGEKK